ncbi:MAG TPA: CHASE2 domain-containing protein [Coleofasciculaceae cyanobacterium]|jgi:CHASE2 domain-containing sensor protein
MPTRGKLVVLRLDGDSFQQGFWVTLSIGEEGERPSIEMTGHLPPAPDLATYLQHHWQEKYRSVGAPYRIKPTEIVYDGSVNKRLKECQESASELRSRLKTWLECESFRPIDKRLREELHRDEAIRVLIRTEDPQLQKLPWQEWDFFERYPKAEVALSSTEFERHKTSTTPPLKSKLRILAILGHSEGINTEADRQLLKNLPSAEVTFLVERTRREINDYLWEQPWDVIFFAGHSETEGETGRIYINKTDSLTISELWYALKKAVERGLKLAIFNSCDGLGLARQLDNVQIPQMIVMRELVPDQVAQEFLKYFLTAFAGGKCFYLAVREARERLQGLESNFPCASWLPVIYQNLAGELLSWPEPRPIKFRRWLVGVQTVLVASLVVTGLVMGMRSLGLLQSSELKVFDQMMQLRPAEKPDPRLLIVNVTTGDIKKLGGEYPLHDRTLLRLLKKLEEYQPRVIGLDIYRDRQEGEGHADLVKYLQQGEVQGASYASNVIPVCVVPSPKIPEGIAPPPGVSQEQLGFGDVVRDPDGVVRRHLWAMEPPAASPCSTYYALSFQLARRYLKTDGISSQFLSENHWQIGRIVFKKLENNTGFYHRQVGLQGFQVLLNYRSHQSPKEIAEQVTLTDVLNNKVKPNFIKNKIILIGVTDPSIADDFNTPYNQEIRGLLLHAQMVSQIISAVKEQRSFLWFLPLGAEIFWVWGWSVVGGIVAWQFLSSPLRLALTSGITIITSIGISFIFMLMKGGVVPLVPSGLALVITGLVIVAYKAFKKRQSQ